jgi:hypothetical protein
MQPRLEASCLILPSRHRDQTDFGPCGERRVKKRINVTNVFHDECGTHRYTRSV